MHASLNTISFTPGGGFDLTELRAQSRRRVSQGSPNNSTELISEQVANINVTSVRSRSEPIQTVAPTPSPISMPAAEQMTKLRYRAMAAAVHRLIAGVMREAMVLLVGVAGLVAGLSQGTAAETPTPKEYQLKAAFLYNFAKFVEWPAQAFPDKTSPITIGIFGKNPFGAELEKAVKDRMINGRAIVVKLVGSAEEAKNTHLLFVSATDKSRLDELQEALKGSSVLTVGESEAFAKQMGIIKFILEGDKLRFEINMDAAEQAGLKVSAQLQKLAKAVRRNS